MGVFNRTILILGLIGLAGFLAWIKVDAQNIAGIIAAVSGPLTGYIVAKGTGK
jgi:hypothetical protein